MEYTIDFETFDKKRLSTVFSKEVKNNLSMLHEFCDYESFLETCVNNTIHVLSMKERLGRASKSKDDFSYCIFCSDHIYKNQFKRILTCNHEFHKSCIDKWIFKYYSTSCPCCLQKL